MGLDASSARKIPADAFKLMYLASRSNPSPPSSGLYLRGKRAAMVTFSAYPADPRPRRAVEALIEQGMKVDLICLADETGPRRETLKGVNVLRLPINHRRAGKVSYLYNYFVFILMSAGILGVRSFT